MMGFKRVHFIGFSKGGFGALLWSSILNHYFKGDFELYCVAFSPQVVLHPYNDNLRLASYRVLTKRAQTKPLIQNSMEKFGNLVEYTHDKLPRTIVVYSKNVPMDKHEAERLYHMRNITLYPIDFSVHSSILPFLFHSLEKDALLDLYNKILLKKETDKDLQENFDLTFDEFMQTFQTAPVPTLKDFIASIKF